MAKEKTWTEVVYQIILEENKEIDLQTICERAKKQKKLTPDDLKITYYQPKFNHSVRSTLEHLYKKGLIIRVDRGVYKLK